MLSRSVVSNLLRPYRLEKAMAPHSSTLAWKIPWTIEQLHFHFSLAHIGEGNGNPLQCSCLENSRDRGAWWAAVYGVAQSRTRLKRLSSSSSRLYPARLLCPWDFSSRNIRVGCDFLLQGIFLTQGSNPQLLRLLHCRQIP